MTHNNSFCGPVVSVLLPVSRDDGYLLEAIDSILNQTYKNIEVIIIANNCAADVINRIKGVNDRRIKLLELSIGQIPHALNHGIEAASGEYIARMDADDLSNPSRIEVQLKHLLENPDVDLIGSHYEYIDECGNHIGYPRLNAVTNSQIKKRLPYESCIPHPTVMAKKECLIKNAGYCYGLFAEDWDLWLRLSRAGVIMEVIRPSLLKYRIHGNQSISSKNFYRNNGYVLGLLMREFMITKRGAFLFGMVYHITKGMAYRIYTVLNRNN